MTLLRTYPVRMRVRNRNPWNDRNISQWRNEEELQNENPQTWYPAVDIIEKEDQFIVTAELPGLSEDDVKLSVHNEVLTIQGDKQPSESDKSLTYSERRYGQFERTVQLNEMVNSENISAYFQNGVLEVVLPKAEKTQEKNIPVQFKN